ncbi:MAG: hypothetical protein ACYSR9_10625 [Planctomycetota bacterium]
MRQIKPLRILFLFGIAVVLFLVILYADYMYGLRRHPKALWNRRKTEHFHIYTNLGSASLDYYEHFFEGFFEYFDSGFVKIGQKRRLKVYLFKDTISYKPYAESVRAQYTPYGFYKGPWVNIIVVNRDSGLGTATHELVHHFIATSFAKEPPEWVNEGIATFFEKFIGHLDKEGKLTISVGYFSNWRFPITKKNTDRLSLSRLISAAEPDQCAARSLMLFLHKKGLFRKFVQQMSTQTNDLTGSITLQKVYGKSIGEIEQDWKDWIRSQPIDGNVKLVERAFVKTDEEWQRWWNANKARLYWREEDQIYRVKD